MTKKLARLINPSAGVCYFVMFGFGVAAILLGEYLLAAAELAITLLLFVLYLSHKAYRRRELQAFLQKTADEQNSVSGAQAPFPMVVIRLSDGGIVHVNDVFAKLTGFRDTVAAERPSSSRWDMKLLIFTCLASTTSSSSSWRSQSEY